MRVVFVAVLLFVAGCASRELTSVERFERDRKQQETVEAFLLLKESCRNGNGTLVMERNGMSRRLTPFEMRRAFCHHAADGPLFGN